MHIELVAKIRNIAATDYQEAKRQAFDLLMMTESTENLLECILQDFTKDWWQQFDEIAKVAKEADGTFTVTIP